MSTCRKLHGRAVTGRVGGRAPVGFVAVLGGAGRAGIPPLG